MLFSPEVTARLGMPFAPADAPGTPADAPAASAALAGGVEVQLGRVASAMEAADRRRSALAASAPSYVPFTGVGTISAGGLALIDMSGPPMGMRWMVRVASVWPAAGVGVSMGAAVAQLGTGQPWLMAPQNVRWAFASLGNVANFGSDEFPVVYGEHVLAGIQAGTPGQIVIATVLVQLFDPFSSAALAAEQI